MLSPNSDRWGGRHEHWMARGVGGDDRWKRLAGRLPSRQPGVLPMLQGERILLIVRSPDPKPASRIPESPEGANQGP